MPGGSRTATLVRALFKQETQFGQQQQHFHQQMQKFLLEFSFYCRVGLIVAVVAIVLAIFYYSQLVI